MDIERSLVSSALTSGRIGDILARGIGSHLFVQRPNQQATPAEVFEWAAAQTRKHGACPSPQLVQANFPAWYGESSSDPLEALIEEFVKDCKRRVFGAKLSELAAYGSRPDQRHRLDELMLEAARDMMAILPSSTVGRLSEMEQRVEQYEIDAAAGVMPGYRVGIPVFDELTHGIQPGDIYTLCGTSGRGKSAISLWMLLNTVEQGANGLMLSLEMTRREIEERIDTMVMNFSSHALQSRKLDQQVVDYWRRTAQRYKTAASDMLFIDGLGGCSVDRVYAEISRYKPHVTVVDFIQRMRAPQASKARWEALDEAANELKTIAVQTDSAIILCSQDNRGAFDTGSTETSAAGSIGIYQASNVYVGMHQDSAMEAQNKLELRMLKSRRSSKGAGQTALLCDFDTMTFKPWEEGDSARAFSRQ